MAEITSTPTARSHRDEGLLNKGISASATTITVGPIFKYPSGVKTKQGFDTTGGFAEISFGGAFEIISFGSVSVDATTKVTTLTDVRRGLSQTSTTQSLTAGTGKAWAKGARIAVVYSANDLQATAFTDLANTFTANQLISSTNELQFNDSATAIWDDGTTLRFKSSSQGSVTLDTLAATGGSDEKVGVDSGATAGYLGAASNDGVLRTDSSLSYTDGGDFVTLGIAAPVSVANGGTGATSITENGVMIGEGTSAVTTVAPGTSGNVLTSDGTDWTSSPISPEVESIGSVTAASSSVGASDTSENAMSPTWTGASSVSGLAVGDVIHIRVGGEYRKDSGDLTLRVKFGGSTVASLLDAFQGDSATRPWHADIMLCVRTVGASGTVYASGSFVTDSTVAGSSHTAGGATPVGEITLDNSGTEAITVTAQYSVSDAQHACNIQTGSIIQQHA